MANEHMKEMFSVISHEEITNSNHSEGAGETDTSEVQDTFYTILSTRA